MLFFLTRPLNTILIKKRFSIQYRIPGDQSTPLTKSLHTYKAKAKICLFFILVPFMWHFFCTKQNIPKTVYIQRSEIIIRQEIINDAIYYGLGYHYALLCTIICLNFQEICACQWTSPVTATHMKSMNSNQFNSLYGASKEGEISRWKNIPDLKKEWQPDTCCNMDKPWKYHANWNKPDTKGQIFYDSSYAKYLK